MNKKKIHPIFAKTSCWEEGDKMGFILTHQAKEVFIG